MKIRTTILRISVGLSLFSCGLFADETCCKTTPIGWIDHREVHISGSVFYIDTNLGPVELTILEYDGEKGCYLVECIKHGDFFYPTPERLLK